MKGYKEAIKLKLLWYPIIVVCAVLLPTKLLAQKEFYTPKSLLIPLHDQKNQVHLSFGRGGGYDFNLSYTFTDKLAIFSTATFDYGTKKRISLIGDRYNVDRNDYAIKGGLGYFRSIDNPYFPTIEAYVGAGITRVDNYWHFTGNTDGEVTQSRYWSVFGQYNVGKRVAKSEYAFGIRLNYSQYTDFNFYDTHPNSFSMKSSYSNLKGLTAEPVLSAGYTFYGVNINGQLGVAIPVVSPAVERTNAHLSYEGTTEKWTRTYSEEKVRLYAFIGRLGLQYKFNFKNQK